MAPIKTIFLIPIALMLITYSFVSVAAECLIISNNPYLVNSKIFSTYEADVRRAFEKAGYCLNFKTLPNKRAQFLIKAGKIDAEMVRTAQYIGRMKGFVVSVPTPLIQNAGYLVTTKTSGFTPDGMIDLKNKKTGIILGNLWQESMTRDFKNLYKIGSYKLLSKMLIKGRIDTFFVDALNLNNLLSKSLLSSNDIVISKAIINLSGFIVLHKKHKSKITQLNNALREILGSSSTPTHQ